MPVVYEVAVRFGVRLGTQKLKLEFDSARQFPKMPTSSLHMPERRGFNYKQKVRIKNRPFWQYSWERMLR
jgi:hypothetical protein